MKHSFDSMPLPVPGAPSEGLEIPNQCTATNRAGDRCRRSASFGFNVCNLHGGAAPQTMAAQKRRLMAAAGDALENLITIANTADDDGLKFRANLALFDRGGHSPTLKISHEDSSNAPWTAWLTNEEIDLARELRDRAIARMDAGEQPFGGVREFNLPEVVKEVWLPKSDRPLIGDGDDAIEAVYTETQTEGQ